MSSAQRIIKYFAIALACLIIAVIITGITSLCLVFGKKDNKDILTDDMIELIKLNEVKTLNIDIKSSSLSIEVGDEFKVLTNNKYIEYKDVNGEVKIKEKESNWFNSEDSKVIVYIPNTLDKIDLSAGAGVIEINELNTQILDFELGAGKVVIDNLNVTNRASIDSGAGDVSIINSSINNLDIDLGVGKFSYQGSILGVSEVDHGIGEANIDLVGIKDDYQIKIDKGVGSVVVDNVTINNDTTIGNGSNKIELDCGVGSITINYNV